MDPSSPLLPFAQVPKKLRPKCVFTRVQRYHRGSNVIYQEQKQDLWLRPKLAESHTKRKETRIASLEKLLRIDDSIRGDIESEAIQVVSRKSK
jgi:hypothetical protein